MSEIGANTNKWIARGREDFDSGRTPFEWPYNSRAAIRAWRYGYREARKERMALFADTPLQAEQVQG